MSEELEAYLSELRRELRLRGAKRERIIEEVQGHLLDAIEAAEGRGIAHEIAARQAISKFGPARALAKELAAAENQRVHRVALVAAIALGMAIAYVDSRTSWDDTGVSAGMVLLSSGILGAVGPQRPWLWALCVGSWIPLLGLIHGGSVASLLALAVAFTGAYCGKLIHHVFVPA